MLAIITPNPDATAETFIRQHIRLIAPRHIAVLYFEGEGKAIQAIPKLKIHRPVGRGLQRKLRSLWNLGIHGYSGSLDKNQTKRVVAFFRENNVTCVLAEFGQTACAIKATCQAVGIPLYAFFHGQDASSAGRTLKYQYSYWRMSRYAAKIFVPTNFLADTAVNIGIPRQKIHIVPYGVDVDEFHPADTRDPNLVVAVGRMVAKKAPHLTVQAFAQVHKEIPQARLEMVGDGAWLERAKARAGELGIEGNIVFHGARDHSFVKHTLARASVFVQHSLTAPDGDTESLGVSLLEAMACEVPVVTTRHNGFIETIDDGVTGFLVEERDVNAMAQRIIQLLNDHDLRVRMGKAGRQRVITYYESKQQAILLRGLMEV